MPAGGLCHGLEAIVGELDGEARFFQEQAGYLLVGRFVFHQQHPAVAEALPEDVFGIRVGFAARVVGGCLMVVLEVGGEPEGT